jgi:hypothetical protein
MAGFIRRYGYFPTQQVIQQIEGVVIVDTPPPQSIQGVNTGVVGMVGEFADVTYATSVDGTGSVTTKIQPVEVVTAQDMLNKVGGWDPTLGDFGADDGNGYFAVSGKIFSRLILAPINNASSKAMRMYRELPLSQSASVASANPQMQAASVSAGAQFTYSTQTVLSAKRVQFTADAPIAIGTNGVLSTATAVTQTFTSSGADFAAANVKVGDALVLGHSATGDYGTYRITAVGTTTLTVQKLDGASWTPAGTSGLVYRVHPAATFDTGGNYALADNAGCTVMARPTVSTIVDGTICSSTLSGASVPVAAGAWDPLSGLKFTAQAGDVTYTAALQAPNAAQSATMDAAYQLAIDGFLADADPTRDVSIIFSARTSATIRQYLYQHVQSASAQGRGRVACISPSLTTVSEDTVIGNASPGVGATRSERVIYNWPGVTVQQQAAVTSSSSLKRANGTYNLGSGLLDTRTDGFMASILSNLASERNPGQATDPVPVCLAPVLGFQSGDLASFKMADYIRFKQYGISAIRFDRGGVKVFQSGITSSLTSGQTNINRRRMADEIEDSLAEAWLPLTKQVMTQQLRDNIDAETVAYLAGLQSPTNPSAQRIEAYSVDSTSGNTPELLAAGIYVVIVRVKMLATADEIVLQAEIGPGVNIVAQ